VRNLIAIQIISDIVMIMTAWIMAFYFRFSGLIEAPRGIPESFLYLKLLPFIATIWILTFLLTGHYQRSQKYRSPRAEALDIILMSILGVLLFISFTYFYEEYKYSRLLTVIFAATNPFAIILGRSLVRKAIRAYSKALPPLRTLIIASQENADRMNQLAMNTTYWQNSEIVGVIHPKKPITRTHIHLPIIETPDDWLELLSTLNLSQVFISIDASTLDVMENIIPLIAEQVPTVKIIPALGNINHLAPNVEVIDGEPTISLYESPLKGSSAFIKRLLDIMGATIALIIFSPIMLLIGISIRLSSPGKILYHQERVGLDGRTFQCLKFRSMPMDAESKSGAMWAHAGDHRATRVGRILRRTSLDELPQLFNVVRGDMSLIGPRPERPVFVSKFRKKVPGYMLRHKVKAGITGWAQVNGWRGNTSIEKRIECDLFYVQNWSLWLDVKIALKTINEVLFGKNAY